MSLNTLGIFDVVASARRRMGLTAGEFVQEGRRLSRVYLSPTQMLLPTQEETALTAREFVQKDRRLC